MKIAVFPGTFDPITLGHTDIIDRSLDLFDKIIVGIGINSNKQPMFPVEQRINWIKNIYKEEKKIEVLSYEGLTVNFCDSVNANFIIRGLRTVSDFEYEKAISDMNQLLDPLIETIFLACTAKYASFSSTMVRDVIRNNGDSSLFLPMEIHQPIAMAQQELQKK
ncbi:MAG: pantetheine-phosphate adenylyltransferase [Bacteroidetes bacterium]|jgi:pantetheine-phosphate adenylyltransferase|nr:pantetheine-phosphate adenylyltransferase [Bacteroidota bacterium]HMT34971.1 pantetheine-phosphate adenylyltransferase [Chitinophagaceae bacterium]MBK6819639.1 pantetheine-phosphate adenylyltransferase [Bacteroidota bacterium]MBK7039491.1 pantetheine-phosphate adenylyltransferase [Bacteroidota bacterium]MBK7589095.1 pantetheine-phosphate adenylyltransferase [Bacteroidota bacterium]